MLAYSVEMMLAGLSLTMVRAVAHFLVDSLESAGFLLSGPRQRKKKMI